MVTIEGTINAVCASAKASCTADFGPFDVWFMAQAQVRDTALSEFQKVVEWFGDHPNVDFIYANPTGSEMDKAIELLNAFVPMLADAAKITGSASTPSTISTPDADVVAVIPSGKPVPVQDIDTDEG